MVLLKFWKIHRKTHVPEPEACNLIKKETLAQVAPIFKNNFPYRTPPVVASVDAWVFFTNQLNVIADDSDDLLTNCSNIS